MGIGTDTSVTYSAKCRGLLDKPDLSQTYDILLQK